MQQQCPSVCLSVASGHYHRCSICFLPVQKLPSREIYSVGGALLIASINVQHLLFNYWPTSHVYCTLLQVPVRKLWKNRCHKKFKTILHNNYMTNIYYHHKRKCNVKTSSTYRKGSKILFYGNKYSLYLLM